MPGHQVSLGGKGEEHMLELDTRKLILVKADIGQYSGDSESDRSVLEVNVLFDPARKDTFSTKYLLLSPLAK